MNVDSRISYSHSEDKVLGPNTNVQVVMMRGLCHNWKQPIFYDFDRTMTAELLQEIIRKVEETGFLVFAVVSDMGGKNQKVWNQLHVNTSKTFFYNPVDKNSKVWVFCDVLHLLKLLRNHLLDDGITLSDGTIINQQIMVELFNRYSTELTVIHHISHCNINVTGRARQNVRLAARLFSRKTAKAIHNGLHKEGEAIFFDVFDIFNSKIPKDQQAILKNGYGLHKITQDGILQRFFEVCSQSRFGKSRCLLPFQKGFLISIQSLKGLFEDVKEKKGTYILTSRLNQDCLENFFSRLRGLGAFYDHPSPVEVHNRIKLLVLSGNSNEIPLSRSSAVRSDEITDKPNETSSPSLNTETEDEFRNFITKELLITISDKNQPNFPSESNQDSSWTEENESFDRIYHTEQDITIKNSSDTGEGLKYIAGYIAFRCRHLDHTLGTLSAMQLPSENATPDWITTISRGGLTVPSPEWFEQIKQFEVIFAGFHNKDISKQKNVMQSLCDIISTKFPKINENIISLYVRTRTFIRIKYLNKTAQDKALQRASTKKSKKWTLSSRNNFN